MDEQSGAECSGEFAKSVATSAVGGNQSSLGTESNVQKLQSVPFPHTTEICTSSGTAIERTHVASEVTSTVGNQLLADNDAETFAVNQDALASRSAEDSKAGDGSVVGIVKDGSDTLSKGSSKERRPGVIRQQEPLSQEFKKNEERKSVMIVKSHSKNASSDVTSNSVSYRDASIATHIPNANQSNSSEMTNSRKSLSIDKIQQHDGDVKPLAKEFGLVDASKVAVNPKTSSDLNVA